MSGLVSTDRVSLTRLTRQQPLRGALAADVRRGLTGPRKWLPPIYFYDARGSALFERITELEEYYPTRVERQILVRHADELVGAIAPCELLELGSGSSAKTDLLLASLQRARGRRYAALEISETALTGAIERLGPRLVVFLGSTLGNLAPTEREVLLSST